MFTLKCPYCGRCDFQSARGLNQHQQQSKPCIAKMRKQLGVKTKANEAHSFICVSQIHDTGGQNFSGNMSEFFRDKCQNTGQIPQELSVKCKYTGKDLPQKWIIEFRTSSSTLDDMDSDDNNFYSLNDDKMSHNLEVNLEIWRNFHEYVEFAQNHLIPFTNSEKIAIDLLIRLRRTKASLRTYEEMMDWHLRATGMLQNQQSVTDCSAYLSRNQVINRLKKRYNMSDDKYGIKKNITLSYSKTKVTIIMNDVQAALESMLTDPRIQILW